jgi:uncharacterized membrane protein
MTKLESIFAFLFKYRPIVFERGELAFGTSFSVAVIALAGVAVLSYVALAYSRARARGRVDLAVLGALRISILALLLFCLARPMLLIPTVVPQRNFLGIVIDDSRSMRIADRDEEARTESVQRHFASSDSTLRAALEERFLLRFFRFANSTERVDEVETLTASGSGTDLAQALDVARRELAAVPLAGLVVLTDGADNSEASLTETTLALQAASVPVYSVGLGRERFERDVQLSRVETPRSVLLGSSLAVDLVIEQNGYRRQDVQVNIEDDGRIVASPSVRLPGDGESATVRVQFTAAEPGPRIFRFSIAPQAGELIAENNTRESLIVVEDARRKILYFEGEPRYELKFIRRAVEEDENLQVVALQRTAADKFLRLDVDGAEELAAGFPRTREELFRYKGLILGSVEASFFTHDQLRMIEEFVGQRGGGLLVLGGRLALERGGYQGTPLADVLPIVLPEQGVTPETFLAELRVRPTVVGRAHPATQIAADIEESARRWTELPAVTSVNAIVRVKPGASTLLESESSQLDEPLVVLAHQRYGRGKALALPIQDSWIWQMHADMPLDDMTHETFWQQLLRWLVSYVPDAVNATVSHDRVGAGDPVTINAEVQDETYLKVNNAEVVSFVTSPSGVEDEIRLDWEVESDGEYSAPFVPVEAGLHEVRVRAAKNGEFLGEHSAYVEATELSVEYFDAELRAPLLRRLAEETGGRFYTPETISSLPEDVSFTQSGTTVIEERDLWDMPIIFLLLIALLGVEWGYRRWRGLV